MKNVFLALGLALLSGCATQQLRFQPWKGIPAEAAADVKRGVFPVSQEKLFDAAAATLEHEPYLHWTFSSLDKANRLIIGSAGVFREIQVRVTEAEEGKSRMAVSIPRRQLKTQAKIYTLSSDPSFQTAYEPEAAELHKYSVQAADAVLGPDYFYSFTHRVLNDRTQVPFVLQPYDEPEAQGMPPAQESALTPQSSPPAPEGAPAGVSPPAAGGGSLPAIRRP